MKSVLTAVVVILLQVGVVLAAPAPPVFEKPVKVGEGELGRRLNKRIVFSGTSVYAGFAGSDGWSVQVAKSENGGATWGKPQEIRASAATAPLDANSICLAISDNPRAKGKKVVHVAWQALEPARSVVYYAYLIDQGKKSTWSTPVRIDLGAAGDGGGTSLAVTGNGVVHILQNVHAITAGAFDAPFGAPLDLPEPVTGMTYLAADSDNTLYATYVDGNRQLKLTKKTATAAAWSVPVTIHEATEGDLSNDHSLVVLSPATYYLAVYSGYGGKGTATLLLTTDGGTSWAKRNIFADEVDGDNSFSLAATTNKVISFAAESYDAQGKSVIKVWRSEDNGDTWSKPTTVKGEKLPKIALDGNGKLHLLVMDETGKRNQNAKLLWLKEK